jgi:hypothetical protein
MDIAFHEERQIFYYELGLAVTQWATVEHAFQYVFTSSFKHYDLALADTFYSIENFRSKLQAADAAFRRNLKPEFQTEWEALHQQLRKRSQIRNQLAHRYIINKPSNKPGRRILLAPREAGEQQFGVRDLVLYRYAFYGLSNQLLNFADRISGAKAPFEVPQGALERPPSLHGLLRQMRGEPEPPHRPSRG